MFNELQQTIDAINVSYRTFFEDEVGKNGLSPIMSRMVMTLNTTAQVENYVWLTQNYGVRRWIGEREIIDGFAQEYLIRNEEFEGTVQTMIRDIQDGRVAGTQESRIRGLVTAYYRRQEQMIWDLILNGFTAPSASNDIRTIDGKALFANDHPWWDSELIKAQGTETYKFDPTGTFDNLSDQALDEDALWAAWEQFALMTNHQGEPANVVPDLLVVGPSLARTARKMLMQDSRITDAGGGSYVVEQNDTKGLFDLAVEPRLGNSTKWFLFDTSKEQKPFILQERLGPVLQQTAPFSGSADAGMVSEEVFHHRRILHGIYGRFGAGYGLPYYSYGSTGTA